MSAHKRRDFQSVVAEQNNAYKDSVTSDCLKVNQQITELLDTYAAQKEEQSRLDRIEKLNSMSARERREFILQKTHPELSETYLNVTGEELKSIPTDYLLLYTIRSSGGNDYHFAYSLEKLYKDNKIVIDPNSNTGNTVVAVNLPIYKDVEGLNYHVNCLEEADAQWNYELLQENINKLSGFKPRPKRSSIKNRSTNSVDKCDNTENTENTEITEITENTEITEITENTENTATNTNDRIATIKRLSLEQLSQLGITFVCLDPFTQNIELLIYSDFTDTDIVQKVIELVIEQNIYS